jgi:hypothetical protein
MLAAIETTLRGAVTWFVIWCRALAAETVDLGKEAGPRQPPVHAR